MTACEKILISGHLFMASTSEDGHEKAGMIPRVEGLGL